MDTRFRKPEERQLGVWLITQKPKTDKKKMGQMQCIGEILTEDFPLDCSTLVEIYRAIRQYGEKVLKGGELREIAFETLRVAVYLEDTNLPIVLIAAPVTERAKVLQDLGRQVLKLFRERHQESFLKEKEMGELKAKSAYAKTIEDALKTQDSTRSWYGGVLPMKEETREVRDTRFDGVFWEVDFRGKKKSGEEGEEEKEEN
jgi:hypothetical protein